jgi:hypothetical protein
LESKPVISDWGELCKEFANALYESGKANDFLVYLNLDHFDRKQWTADRDTLAANLMKFCVNDGEDYRVERISQWKESLFDLRAFHCISVLDRWHPSANVVVHTFDHPSNVAIGEGATTHNVTVVPVPTPPSGTTMPEQEEHGKCIICMDNDADTLLTPCGHFGYCWGCAARLVLCPNCRQEIKERIKVFNVTR